MRGHQIFGPAFLRAKPIRRRSANSAGLTLLRLPHRNSNTTMLFDNYDSNDIIFDRFPQDLPIQVPPKIQLLNIENDDKAVIVTFGTWAGEIS